MSMIGNYRRVSAATLEDLRRNPEPLARFLYDDAASSSGDGLDIDKSWHIIHFLLTGDPWKGKEPWVNVVLGGTPVSEESVGYGPARYLTPPQVAEVAQALSTLSAEDLLARWDDEAIAEADIYPNIWDDESPEELEYVSDNYEAIREIFARAAQNGDAMIVWLS